MRYAMMAALVVGVTAIGPLPLYAQEAAGPFNVNPGLFIWMTVLFLFLMGVLGRFAWGPILDAVQGREERIQGALDEAARQQAEARDLLEEHRQQLAQSRRQAQEIVAEAKAASEKVRHDIEERARQQGQALIDRAQQEIDRQKEEAMAELRRASVELALAAASKLLGERLDGEKDERLVSDYLDGFSGGEGKGASA